MTTSNVSRNTVGIRNRECVRFHDPPSTDPQIPLCLSLFLKRTAPQDDCVALHHPWGHFFQHRMSPLVQHHLCLVILLCDCNVSIICPSSMVSFCLLIRRLKIRAQFSAFQFVMEITYQSLLDTPKCHHLTTSKSAMRSTWWMYYLVSSDFQRHKLCAYATYIAISSACLWPQALQR